MNVLSLFDGISCCHLALDKVGINVDRYYASEIDKYAIKVTQSNYDKTVQLGSVLDFNNWSIDWSNIDLVTGGFPCQAWSIAGNQLGDRDERGALFWVMLDIMKKVLDNNPNVKILIENVKMKKDFEEYITHHTIEALGYLDKHLINSSLFSGQNRQRYYWTNINVDSLPEDKGVLVKDIIEDIDFHDKPQYLKNKLNGKERAFSVKDINDTSNCLTATMYKGQICSYIKNETETKKGKSYALTASYGGAVAWNSIQKKQRTMIPICKTFEVNPNVVNGVKYRKLTPLECERLQTIPDNYTNHVSKTQRYKMIGNSWTVDVIAHIFKGLKQ